MELNNAIRQIFFGAVVIVLALWAIIGEQITGASSNAIVNARISTIRLPIPGIIDVPLTTVRTEFQMGETVARVKNTLSDVDYLSNLQMDASIMGMGNGEWGIGSCVS